MQGPVGDLGRERTKAGTMQANRQNTAGFVFTRTQLWIEDPYRSCIRRQQKV